MQIGVGGIPSVIILVSMGTGHMPRKARRIPGETEGLPIKTPLVSIKKSFDTAYKAVKESKHTLIVLIDRLTI